ncbi:hypothetical protein PoB_005163700 [Plakobranchus ocellatus]|uniref:Uncharacterized protein n=1 Tax=Plakobranchus ocellatus TaxID=259542 RepID=A0AAV4C1A9_9GAST|nr:hypothetical protein PoB_005163700 [Plakobranchus ocellatus]
MTLDFDTDNDTALPFQMNVEITLQKSPAYSGAEVDIRSNGKTDGGNPAYRSGHMTSEEAESGREDCNSAVHLLHTHSSARLISLTLFPSFLNALRVLLIEHII